MATIRNTTDSERYVIWGRRQGVWVAPDETTTVDDDTIDDYTITGQWDVVPGTPPLPPVTPAPPAPSVPDLTGRDLDQEFEE